MSESAPPQCSCQLETRHWIITDEEGNEERVDGPGVVGKPVVISACQTRDVCKLDIGHKP